MILLLLLICCVAISVSRQHSFTKYRGIYLNPCKNSYGNMFPLDKNPTDWVSCEDAYHYTWTSDFDNVLVMLNATEKLKLVRSTGFCPHRRCQLGNASSAANSGYNQECPIGLCYTKLENGSPSYGACCFTNGVIDTGDIIGVYYKSQPSPKPIYQHSAVLLNSRREYSNRYDEVEDRFINANQVLPGLILTQCPLTGQPEGYANTLEDIRQMIVDYNVSLWIQLNPTVLPELVHIDEVNDTIVKGYHDKILSMLRDKRVSDTNNERWRYDSCTEQQEARKLSDVDILRRCQVFPFLSGFRSNILVHHLHLPVHFDRESGEDIRADREDGKAFDVTYTNITVSLNIPTGQHSFEYIWYSRWEDFHVPPPYDDKIILKFARLAADIIIKGGNVVVSCTSGRGRSGTFAAIVSAFVHGAQKLNCSDEDCIVDNSSMVTIGSLVDVVVKLRENRDGMVELPEQFYYVAKLLGFI